MLSNIVDLLQEQSARSAIVFGWMCIIGGIVSGACLGLFFHRAQFLGGYNSFQRRLLRLGHVAFMGMGFANIFCGLTVNQLGLQTENQTFLALKVAACTMPLICFLTAWKQWFRHVFFIPVLTFTYSVIKLLGDMFE